MVRILDAEGVESYRADLVRHETIYYAPDGSTHIEKIHHPDAEISSEFSASGVVAAIRESQAGSIRYQQFLDQVMRAGVSSYTVYLRGRRCIYFGRNGDFHIEEFPAVQKLGQ